MKHLYLKSLSGKNHGRIALNDDGTVTTDTAAAEDVFSSFVITVGDTRAEAFAKFLGWSNGYAVVAEEPWPMT